MLGVVEHSLEELNQIADMFREIVESGAMSMRETTEYLRMSENIIRFEEKMIEKYGGIRVPLKMGGE